LRSLIKAHAQGIIIANYDQEKFINQVIACKCKWIPTRIGKPPSLLSLVFGVGFWCVRIQRGLNHLYKSLGPLEACSRSCVWNLCWVILWFHVGWTFIKFKISIVFLSWWVLVNVKESSIAKTIEGLSSIELNMKRWCGFERCSCISLLWLSRMLGSHRFFRVWTLVYPFKKKTKKKR